MKRITLSIIAIITIFSLSCKKDDKGSSLKAVFSYVADGFVVNFTDFSQNAQEYKWDFGDNSEVSARTNPSHIYRAKGTYMVTLTVTNNGETNSFTDSVYVLGPNIKIDGDYSDWEHVEYSYVNDAPTGTLLKAKAFASNSDVNFYLEGNSDFNLAVFDLYIDADNNPQTGHQSWMYPQGSGAEFLFEGNFNPSSPASSTGSAFASGGPGWDWSEAASFADVMKFGKMGTVEGNKVIEFSVKKSLLNAKNKFINFAIIEMNSGWTEIGNLPASQKATSSYLKVEL